MDKDNIIRFSETNRSILKEKDSQIDQDLMIPFVFLILMIRETKGQKEMEKVLHEVCNKLKEEGK